MCSRSEALHFADPHAVTGITGIKNTTYCYDLTGNMTSGDGRTVTYSLILRCQRDEICVTNELICGRCYVKCNMQIHLSHEVSNGSSDRICARQH